MATVMNELLVGWLLILLVVEAKPLTDIKWGPEDIKVVHVVQGCHLDVVLAAMGFSESH